MICLICGKHLVLTENPWGRNFIIPVSKIKSLKLRISHGQPGNKWRGQDREQGWLH